MRHFGYTQIIPRHPVVSTPPTLTRIQIEDMFDDYESHLIPEKARATVVEREWSYVKGYIKLFLRVSYSYMVQAAPGDLPKPIHREILEEEQSQLDHDVDV